MDQAGFIVRLRLVPPGKLAGSYATIHAKETGADHPFAPLLKHCRGKQAEVWKAGTG